MILEPQEWRRRIADHRRRLEPVVRARLERSSRGERHPVDDFLFTYYRFAPNKLLTWHPGYGVGLESASDLPAHLTSDPYREANDHWRIEPGRMSEATRRQLDFVFELLKATDQRPARHACHGLHEWAMVDGCSQADVRHDGVPLRLAPERISRVIRELKVQCTHYDAYRFFTPNSRPLNRHQPSLETRLEHEQPGCIHTNMDLYKWSSKLSPWVGSDLVADTFELAGRARVLDMRASPYDLRAYGLMPIQIENEAGRREYVREQMDLADQAAPLRRRLLEAVSHLRNDLEIPRLDHDPELCR